MPGKPELTEVVNTQMPLGATLGIRTFGGPDEVDATLSWAPELCTAGSVLHGGVLMTLADTAGAVCAFLNLPPGHDDRDDRVEDEFSRSRSRGGRARSLTAVARRLENDRRRD